MATLFLCTSIIIAAVIVAAGKVLSALILKGSNPMSALDDKIAELKTTVAADTDVHSSAVTLIRGFAQRMADAVAQALAAGATDAQLQAVQEVIDAVKANDAVLADAVTANTPAAPTS